MTIDKNAGFTVTDSSSDSYSVKCVKAKNKKQVDIVKDTGISKGAFSSYLSGQYNPKADKMELIADSLDVDLR